MKDSEIRTTLRNAAESYRARAHVPYSGRPASAAVLAPDGRIVPGVRVESASFPLTIPAALNALTTLYALGYEHPAAMVQVGPIPGSTAALASGHGLQEWEADGWSRPGELPDPKTVVEPTVACKGSDSPERLIALARDVASRAFIPESNFPVGAVLKCRNGALVPGVNVEHPDWSCILCAERNALGTAVTFDLLPVTALVLTCPADPSATPCGACRQLIAEIAPTALVWMDRGSSPAEQSRPDHLLPHAFVGNSLGSQ